MRILLFLYSSLFIISCTTKQFESTNNLSNNSLIIDSIEITERVDSVLFNAIIIPNGSYTSTKQSIKKWIGQGKHSGEDFENYLVHYIIPYWYGTEWDFNGYTAVPNDGVIACGYFVSTTLMHLGVKLDRYKLAQQAGLNEAKSLAILEDKYETIWGIDKLKIALTDRYKDGIYFVGLDNHVGFLYIKKGAPYFIHSNYIEDRVMMEPALEALAFQSNIYVVAELSTNEALLDKWRKGEIVTVIRN